MINWKANLRVLSSILAKKKEALIKIADITETQLQQRSDKTIPMAEEKQWQIDIVLECDSIFQSMFSDIQGELENIPQEFKPDVLELQNAIREVMDLDIKIRTQEEKIKQLRANSGIHFKPIDIPKASKEYILNQYKQNSKK